MRGVVLAFVAAIVVLLAHVVHAQSEISVGKTVRVSLGSARASESFYLTVPAKKNLQVVAKKIGGTTEGHVYFKSGSPPGTFSDSYDGEFKLSADLSSHVVSVNRASDSIYYLRIQLDDQGPAYACTYNITVYTPSNTKAGLIAFGLVVAIVSPCLACCLLVALIVTCVCCGVLKNNKKNDYRSDIPSSNQQPTHQPGPYTQPSYPQQFTPQTYQPPQYTPNFTPQPYHPQAYQPHQQPAYYPPTAYSEPVQLHAVHDNAKLLDDSSNANLL